MPQRTGKRVGFRRGDQNTDAGHLCGWLRNGMTTRGQQPNRAATEQENEMPPRHGLSPPELGQAKAYHIQRRQHLCFATNLAGQCLRWVDAVEKVTAPKLWNWRM